MCPLYCLPIIEQKYTFSITSIQIYNKTLFNRRITQESVGELGQSGDANVYRPG